MQIGTVNFSDRNRACVWRGSAETLEDLSLGMGPQWGATAGSAGYCDGNFLYVVGFASEAGTLRTHAALWYRPLTFCPADFNRDSVPDFFDYLDFVTAFAASDLRADFNADTIIDFNDYLDFISAFAAGC